MEPLLELSWAPVGVTGPSLGALWDSLRGFGWVLSLRCEVAKVCVLEHLGTAREASSWVPWADADTLVGVPWRSLGALSVLFLCFWETSRCRPCFCAIWGGRDVRSVHACACLVRVRLVKKDCLLRPSCGSQVDIKEARRARVERERHPEWHQKRSTVTKMVPNPPVKNRQQN